MDCLVASAFARSYGGQVASRNDDRNNLILLRALNPPCVLARPSDALSWRGGASPGVRGNASADLPVGRFLDRAVESYF